MEFLIFGQKKEMPWAEAQRMRDIGWQVRVLGGEGVLKVSSQVMEERLRWQRDLRARGVKVEDSQVVF